VHRPVSSAASDVDAVDEIRRSESNRVLHIGWDDGGVVQNVRDVLHIGEIPSASIPASIEMRVFSSLVSDCRSAPTNVGSAG